MSHQKIYTSLYRTLNDEKLSTLSQIVEQIKVIQKIALPEISKLTQH